ncbi:MAG: hypothetical protein VR64_04265 [Desulfatitalea sp. BRH_c12]|nr:MAG: hypothetical protein VR64_04265 [Desulfatitalea sp. BRH_c12]
MNPKRQILKFLKEKMERNPSEKHSDDDSERIQLIMDGMGTGTARLIIEHQIGDTIGRGYTINDLENKGRYYLGKVVQHDGTIIERLIVDKQTGITRFI